MRIMDMKKQSQNKAKVEKTIKSAFLKFEGLLYETGLSPHRSETISIKVEIDTYPPSGAGFETSVVRRLCLLNLQHYDKRSLLASKLQRNKKALQVLILQGFTYLGDRGLEPLTSRV